MGRLYQTTGASGVRQFLYDGDERIGEYDGSSGGLLRRYVHGDGDDDPLLWYEGAGLGDMRSLQSDHQGSIVSVADASGVLVAINSYDEYGVPGGGNIGSFQYTGQAWLPDLGMYYYKARIYSARLGRFLQTDPIGYKDQMDLYAYVENDPVNKRDPSGEELAGALLGALTGAGLDYGMQVVGNLAEGKSLGKSLTDVDLTSIAISGATGALAGATGLGLGALGTKALKFERAAVRARNAYVKAKAGARLGYGSRRMVRISQQAARAARAVETNSATVRKAAVAEAALKTGEMVAKKIADPKKDQSIP